MTAAGSSQGSHQHSALTLQPGVWRGAGCTHFFPQCSVRLGGTGNTDTPWLRDSVLEFSPVNEISLHVNSIRSGGGKLLSVLVV